MIAEKKFIINKGSDILVGWGFEITYSTWILHESEAFICKALKGEAIVVYAEPLIPQNMKASDSPVG